MAFRNRLKTAPPDAVRTLDELFAIAHFMEHEAATRYTQFSLSMRMAGNIQLAELFERLASDERGHEASVLGWSKQRSGKAPSPAALRWALPETFDEAAAQDLTSSRLTDTYRVLSLAVRNEERAFALWSYIAAAAETPEIQNAAERMALEELGHAAQLRRARREAFHAERAARLQGRPLPIEALLAQAARLEIGLADQLRELADGLAGDDAGRARELSTQSREMADIAVALATGPDGAKALKLVDASTTAERLTEIYLEIGDRSRDETVVAAVQALTRQAIGRLTWLRLVETA
jgi:rubrerythrin